MACKSNKKGYEKRKAQEVLNALLKNGKWSKKDKKCARIYPCPDCGYYHITSLKNESADMRGVELRLTNKWKQILKYQKTDGQRVTFQQAQEIKNKGYDKPCNYWYTLFHKKLMYSEISKNFNSFVLTKEATYHSSSYSAPTIEEYTEFKKQLKTKK